MEEIHEHFEYQGQRVKLVARLGKARIPLQVDVGYGDAVTPPPVRAELPVLLDFPKPRLRAYSKETVVAEKFQAMVALDLLNSRMKDFFDVWVLARDFKFQGRRLLQAIAATFKRRKTALPATTPAVFTHLFSKNPDKLRQWQAFLCKSMLGTTEQEAGLTQVIRLLESFLMPPVRALAQNEDFDKVWIPGGPWRGS